MKGNSLSQFFEFNNLKSFSLLTIIFLILISCSSFSQTHFQQIYHSHVNSASITPDGVIYVSADSGLVRSSDFGVTWSKVFGITNFSELIQAPNGILYLSSDKIYRSTDNGFHWNTIQNFSTKFLRIDDHSNVYIVLSSDENRLYRSVDSGLNFSLVHNFKLSFYSYIVEIFCIDSSTTLVTNTWFSYPTGGGGSAVNRSTDFGSTWTNAANEYIWTMHHYGNQIIGWLPPVSLKFSGNKGTTWNYFPTNGIEVKNFISNSNNDLFVSNDTAIYKRPANSIRFFRIDEGLKFCTKLLTYKDSLLFALAGIFLYKRNQDIPTQMLDDKISDFNMSLSQNYPNPFNPSTIIRYTVSGMEGSLHKVSLKIFNLLGQEVVILVNEFKDAGIYESEFNSSRYNLADGVYFYKLTIDESSTVKKMMLLK